MQRQNQLTHPNACGVFCIHGHAPGAEQTRGEEANSCHSKQIPCLRWQTQQCPQITLHQIKTWVTELRDATEHTCGEEDCRLPLEAKSTPMVANTNTPVSTSAPAATPA